MSAPAYSIRPVPPKPAADPADPYGLAALKAAMAERAPWMLKPLPAPVNDVQPHYDNLLGRAPAKADWQFRWNRENDQ